MKFPVSFFFVPSVLWWTGVPMVFHRSTQWQCGNVCHPAHSKQDSQGQGEHPRDWAALQMSKNNLVAFSQSIKSREDHFVNVTRQYQVTVAFLLKIKLLRQITWECHDIHGVLWTQLLSSWVPSAPLVPWGSWWDAVDPKLMLNVSLLWNLQGIMMDYGV